MKHPYNGIAFNSEKEQTPDAHSNSGECQKHMLSEGSQSQSSELVWLKWYGATIPHIYSSHQSERKQINSSWGWGNQHR
jgi:hypothetical protein